MPITTKSLPLPVLTRSKNLSHFEPKLFELTRDEITICDILQSGVQRFKENNERMRNQHRSC